jgi:galactokinase/mevalonate kinase-like predicted kinase
MDIISHPWDYLIVTASNKAQAASYETQLDLRRKIGLLSGVEQVLVVPDPQGQRIGSGGSTVFALLKVINQECKTLGLTELSPNQIENTLNHLRILIIHAGGDSRRLPAYGPCGKIFTPIPGKSDSVLGNTIFDQQFPIYRGLLPSGLTQGQIVVTTGDVLLFFNPNKVAFRGKGVTGLGCYVTPEQAKNHGVFSADRKGEVQHFLQKSSVSQQKEKGVINEQGQSLLDIGVMELDATTATKLITLCNITQKDDEFHWTGPIAEEILSTGLDFYREICCAMGKEVRLDEFLKIVHNSGSKLSESFLVTIFDSMSKVPFYVHMLEECTFLHFGTPRQLIETGSGLLRREQEKGSDNTCLNINNHIHKNGRIIGTKSWVEGCRIQSKLTLEGENVVVGVDVDKPLSLPAKTCLDIIKGLNRDGENVWFVRIYGIDDPFKPPIDTKASAGGHPFSRWIEQKDLWNAKIFPAVSAPNDYHEWLWMMNPSKATTDQIQAWLKADKYSLAEISNLVDLEDFYIKRRKNRAKEIRDSLDHIFHHSSGFSAMDLAYIFENLDVTECTDWIGKILAEAQHHTGFIFSRIIHTLGTAIKSNLFKREHEWTESLHSLYESLAGQDKERLDSVGLDPSAFTDPKIWCEKAQENAFENLSRTIVWSKKKPAKFPRCAVRSDEIIWGRAPARLDLGGGWTDTPPYALEHGGCVINAAVNLNGQPPIHVYARVVEEPVIRITSIDHGLRVTIKDLEDLMDYRKATSEFGLAKAALVLSGFSPDRATWPKSIRTLKNMLERFGGGIELTTLAAIPSGSGLGTSSIMGTVLMSVINKLIGKENTQRELFNLVLQLEQELTTGGGWQDQIGGTIEGVKMITTEPGLVPDPKIQAVRPDVLDPVINKGQTLLYYTGMRRLAKNILQNIVGHYLDRDRKTMGTLRKLHVFPPFLVDAMERKDMLCFGESIGEALQLKKEIDPGSSNPEMEKILEKFKPYMIGATYLGAGGGGFLLVVCKSPEDAATARKTLELDPPNPLARFFDYDISTTGLEVTVC